MAIGYKFTGRISRHLNVYGKVGAGFSNLSVGILNYTTASVPSDTAVRFHAVSLLVEPGLAWTSYIGNFFIRVGAGYELCLSGNTFLNNGDGECLLTPDNNKVRINWTGAPVGIAIGFSFPWSTSPTPQ